MSDLKQTRTEIRPDTPGAASDAAGFGFIARRFIKDTSGSVLIYVGLTSFVFLGFAGLAVDVGHWYASKRTMQSAVDAAALGGVFAVKKGSDDATIVSMAKNDAALNGYDATMGAVVTINHPPSSGPNAGDMGAVEAIIQQPVPGFFSKLIFDGPTTITARAVARAATAPACVYALDPSKDESFGIVGTADVVLDCGVQVNSTSPNAIKQSGTSCLAATSIEIAGGLGISGQGCMSPTPNTGAPAVSDPLADLEPPSYSGCDEDDLVHVTNDTTLYPGVYCGGIHIEADVDFEPGVYVLDGLGLTIEGNSVVTGDEVTFYLEPTLTGNIPFCPGKRICPPRSVLIGGTTAVTLSAPTSGDYEGLLFYQDRDTPPDLVNLLTGTSDMKLTGSLYFPNNALEYAGNTEFGGADWTTIIAREVKFVGTSYLGMKPGGAFASAALATPTLVE